MFPRQKPPEPDLHSAARRIAAAIEAELLQLVDNTRRSHLLGLSWDYLAQRSSDMSGSKRLYQIPLRPEDPFDELLQPIMPEFSGRSVPPEELNRLQSF